MVDQERQRWMRVLALASPESLHQAWQDWTPQPEVTAVRGPEAGLVMVTGRMDAAGDRFHLGEATVTRATVRVHGADLAGDGLGTAYVLGSDLDHAYTAAVLDGLLVEGTHRDRLLAEVVEPLAQAHADADAAAQRAARSTQVDFFTVSREHA